jgi:hypothetical protein
MNHVYSINVNSHPLRIGGELEWVGLRIIVRKEHLKLRNRPLDLLESLALLVIVALVKGLMPGDVCIAAGVLGGFEIHVDTKMRALRRAFLAVSRSMSILRCEHYGAVTY